MTNPTDKQIASLLGDLQRELAASKQANAKQDEDLTKRTGGDYLQQESDRQMEDEIFLLLRNAKYPRAALNHFCRAGFPYAWLPVRLAVLLWANLHWAQKYRIVLTPFEGEIAGIYIFLREGSLHIGSDGYSYFRWMPVPRMESGFYFLEERMIRGDFLTQFGMSHPPLPQQDLDDGIPF